MRRFNGMHSVHLLHRGAAVSPREIGEGWTPWHLVRFLGHTSMADRPDPDPAGPSHRSESQCASQETAAVYRATRSSGLDPLNLPVFEGDGGAAVQEADDRDEAV